MSLATNWVDTPVAIPPPLFSTLSLLKKVNELLVTILCCLVSCRHTICTPYYFIRLYVSSFIDETFQISMFI